MTFSIRAKISFSSFFRTYFANYCSKNMNMTIRHIEGKKEIKSKLFHSEILIFEV